MRAVVRSLKTALPTATVNVSVSEPRKAGARTWFGFVIHEPFFQFMVLGLLIWGGVEYWSAHNGRYTIDIGPAERQRIATGYLWQFGKLPTAVQLQGLIDRDIREMIFLREGLALNLDKDDEIVRRRIVQKYEFLETDLAMPAPPAPDVLKRWFEQNKHRYLTPERVAFSQVYFSADPKGEEVARHRALEVLENLRKMQGCYCAVITTGLMRV